MYYAIEEDEELLEHHGILGQKWGVRRFQNKDGTLTPRGRAHLKENSSDDQNGHRIDGKKIAKGAAIAAGVTAGAILLSNSTTRNALAKYGKTVISELPGAIEKAGRSVGRSVGSGAGKLAKKVSERASKVGDAMIDASLISVGGIAIANLTTKLDPGENATQFEKDRNKVILDTVKAGIETATKSSGGNNNNKTWSDRTGTHVGKEISDKIGAPSNQNIDRSSKAWQNLFKDSNGNQRDSDTRATIKAMANAGYDIDQIDKWLNHSDFEDWASQYMAVEIGW